MKKCTNTSTARQPRRRRSQPRRPTQTQEVQSLHECLRDALVQEIREAVRKTAVQLVEDEVHGLVGEPWSRKGASPLRRGGATSTRVFLDG